MKWRTTCGRVESFFPSDRRTLRGGGRRQAMPAAQSSLTGFGSFTESKAFLFASTVTASSETIEVLSGGISTISLR